MEPRRPKVIRLERTPIVDDLTPHIGKWAAIRDGHVVAASYSLKRLLKDKRVQQTDTLMPVQPPGMKLYATA